MVVTTAFLSPIGPSYYTTVYRTRTRNQHRVFFPMSSSDNNNNNNNNNTVDNAAMPKVVEIPLSWDSMIQQATLAIRDATKAGYTRQIVRLLLPRDKSNADLGRYMERNIGDGGGTLSSSSSSSSYGSSTTNPDNLENIVLCPTDESWQGGIMQLYRSAAPTAYRMVRRLSNTVAGVPVRIYEDRTIDESGVDGIGLIYTSDQSIQCYVQPTQEIVNTYVSAAQTATAEQTLILLNPQWRQVNDALDTASSSNTNSFLSTLASFLGGKGSTMKQIQDVGYVPVYTLEGYVCRGANIRLLQIGYDNTVYHVFCERDDGISYIPIGTYPERPTYQQVDAMLTDANIGYKYARDIGLQPKL
jgi:Domain of unknown function (DUF1995)